MSTISDQLTALGKIATHLQQKVDVPPELWAASGMKPTMKQKDVATKIQELKKRVSQEQKKVAAEASDDDDEPKGGRRQRGEASEEQRVSKEKAPSARKLGQDKKTAQMAADRGDMDLHVDLVGHDE
jgi:hypothetical protein